MTAEDEFVAEVRALIEISHPNALEYATYVSLWFRLFVVERLDIPI